MRRAKKWTRSLALTSALLSTACAVGGSSAVLPAAVAYGPMVQARAADELEGLGPACPRDAIIADCSAVKRMTMDYLWLRDLIRAME